MAESGVTATVGAARTRGQWLSMVARQRELSLVAIMVVLGGLVSITAPQFLTPSNLSQVASLASIIAVAAVGQAIVVITRNIDLSVEATMGLVAYCVAIVLERHALDAPAAIAFGLGLGLVLGMINGVIVTLLRVPAIVATLGTLSIFRGVDYLVAGSHQVPLAGLPPGFTDAARDSILGIPIFVLVALVVVVIGSVVLRSTRFGRQVYAVGSNAEAAAILGIPSRLVVFVAFSACGLLAGVAGVMWVMEFGTINGTSATGVVGRGRGRRRGSGHLRWFRHARRRRARRPVPRIHRERAHPGRPVAVLAPGHLRRGHPGRRQRRRAHPATDPAGDRGAPRSMSIAVAPANGQRRWTRLLARWETLLVVAVFGLVALGASLSPFFLTPGNFSNLVAALMEVEIMALPMTLIIVAAEIDLSVESMAAASAILGSLGGRRAALIGIPCVLSSEPWAA
jgi:rhamnose transport system permease protein